jgi:hypothetical protein
MIRDPIHKLVDHLFDLPSSLLPCKRFPEAREHFRSARREVLLALRTVMDRALNQMEEQGAEDLFVRVPVED